MFPVRMCVGCRGRAAKSELIRLVARDGAAVVDQRQDQPGRGAYLHPRAVCLEQAVKRRTLGHALRSDIDGGRSFDAVEAFLGVVL
jgi:predicted RNA-binding protein YlxR (DUF448 family)